MLVVDDEPKLRQLVRDYLEREGYVVLEAGTGQRALELARTAHPALVVLDLGLPDLPGEDVARLLQDDSAIAVIVLTAKADEGSRVAGLRAGADDYVVKPFSPRELVARIEAVLRRTRGEQTTRRCFGEGSLHLDAEAREVSVDGEPIELTRTEFDLLSALAGRPGRAWSRLELVTRMQGYDYEGYERTVDAHVKNLRRKLGEDPRAPRFVATVPGIGYKLSARQDG